MKNLILLIVIYTSSTQAGILINRNTGDELRMTCAKVYKAKSYCEVYNLYSTLDGQEKLITWKRQYHEKYDPSKYDWAQGLGYGVALPFYAMDWAGVILWPVSIPLGITFDIVKAPVLATLSLIDKTKDRHYNHLFDVTVKGVDREKKISSNNFEKALKYFDI